MAEYRFVFTKMWRDDDWFATLDAEQRVLWVYLFTNPSASVCGMYELSVRTTSNETGLSQEKIHAILAEFVAAGKAAWDGKVIWVKKMRDYQATNSPKVKTRIDKDIAAMPDTVVKRAYLVAYGIASVSIPDHTGTGTGTETGTETGTGTASAAAEKARGDANDPAFGELWKLLTHEHIVTQMSDVLRDDVLDLWKICQDGIVWREAVRRAKSRDPAGANWALVKRIIVDYIRTGSWEKPGGSHGRDHPNQRGSGEARIMPAAAEILRDASGNPVPLFSAAELANPP